MPGFMTTLMQHVAYQRETGGTESGSPRVLERTNQRGQEESTG